MTDDIVRRNVDIVFGLASPQREASTEPPAGTLLADTRRATEGPNRASAEHFSVFNRADAVRASELATSLSRIAERGGPDHGLQDASAAAASIAAQNPGLAAHALGLFATHDPLGRRLPIPTLLKRTAVHAALFTDEQHVALGSKSTGPEAALDWFREDPLANEHHEHWHWVYPNFPPQTKPVKRRHGELFFYMHQQMLARYDAERTALGLGRVEPLRDFTLSVGEGYDPGLLMTSQDYETREANEGMVDQQGYDRATLSVLANRLTTAARDRRLSNGTRSIALTGHEGSDHLGHEAEPTRDSQFPDYYGWHHGMGHMLIAAASDNSLGVMRDTATAIRDPAFWRWHRHIDDIHFLYQDSLDPHSFVDAPPVSIAQISVEHENGGNAGPDGNFEVTTRIRNGVYELVNDQRYRYSYLAHQPFQIRVDLLSSAVTTIAVTLRLFLIPHDLFDPSGDPTSESGKQMRRFAIELDKVKIEAPSGASSRVRAGRDMSVIRRPAVVDPAEVVDVDGEGTDEATQECTCGWPFGLLVPRGTPTGMPFSLFAMVTDNRIDRVGSPKHCGSMSFCGLGDEYPDARPMGYPFDRRLEEPLVTVVNRHPNMKLRPLTIRWAET